MRLVLDVHRPVRPFDSVRIGLLGSLIQMLWAVVYEEANQTDATTEK